MDLPVSWDGSFGQRLGMVYELVEPGHAIATLVVGPAHGNPAGLCHGGVLFTLADDTMGGAVHGLTPDGLVPVASQINVHFTRSVRVAGMLRAETHVLSRGRRTALLQSQVTDKDGRLVALLTATYLFVEARQS